MWEWRTWLALLLQRCPGSCQAVERGRGCGSRGRAGRKGPAGGGRRGCLWAPVLGERRRSSHCREEAARARGHAQPGVPGRWGSATDTPVWRLGQTVPPVLLPGAGPSTSGKSPGSLHALWPSSDPLTLRPSPLSQAGGVLWGLLRPSSSPRRRRAASSRLPASASGRLWCPLSHPAPAFQGSRLAQPGSWPIGLLSALLAPHEPADCMVALGEGVPASPALCEPPASPGMDPRVSPALLRNCLLPQRCSSPSQARILPPAQHLPPH